MNEKVDFLFLTEEEAIRAGANDLHACIGVMEEMFGLVGRGDYLMGAPNRNAHGIKIYFPKETPFPNMPVKGPDRRFMALVAYLGGRFNVCGEKWYGSNLANREKGLPRSILMTLLNDPDTGAPLAVMSANALSAARTGAIPAVGAKYLAKKDAAVLGAVGVGVIGKACVTAILDAVETLREVRIYDLDRDAAIAYARELEEKSGPGLRAVCVDKPEAAVKGCDVVNVAASGSVPPKIEDDWLEAGALLTLPAGAEVSENLMKSSRIVVDNWKMYEAYAEELAGLPGGFSKNLSGICGFLMDLVYGNVIPKEEVINLGDVLAKKAQGRRDGKDKVIFIMDGMPVEDLAWGYTVYRNALEQGIGTKLNLWGNLEHTGES